MSTAEIASLTQTALDALRRGDAGGARTIFDELVARGGTPPWLAVARACNMLGDAAGEEAALKQRLKEDKRDLPALLAMGELKARQRDDRAASAFFSAAINQAMASGQNSAQLAPLLNRAQSFIREAADRYEAHLVERLGAAGLDESSASPRVRHALDLLRGKSQLYLQQPTTFYFPGLPQRQFYERDEFAWLPAVEAAVPAMQAELGAVIAEGEGAFGPYVTGSPDRPLPNNQLLNDPSWGAYYLWEGGAPVPDHAAHCPQVMAALEHAPIPVIAGRSPMALFSLLKPGTHIAPHHGMLNTRLICHVPLIAPPGCALRVGSETREWRESEALIFDDSFEHEAWNRGERTRIVLLFEIWRPEIGEAERAELVTLFEAIDLFPSGDGPDH